MQALAGWEVPHRRAVWCFCDQMKTSITVPPLATLDVVLKSQRDRERLSALP